MEKEWSSFLSTLLSLPLYSKYKMNKATRVKLVRFLVWLIVFFFSYPLVGPHFYPVSIVHDMFKQFPFREQVNITYSKLTASRFWNLFEKGERGHVKTFYKKVYPLVASVIGRERKTGLVIKLVIFMTWMILSDLVDMASLKETLNLTLKMLHNVLITYSIRSTPIIYFLWNEYY